MVSAVQEHRWWSSIFFGFEYIDSGRFSRQNTAMRGTSQLCDRRKLPLAENSRHAACAWSRCGVGHGRTLRPCNPVSARRARGLANATESHESQSSEFRVYKSQEDRQTGWNRMNRDFAAVARGLLCLAATHRAATALSRGGRGSRA